MVSGHGVHFGIGYRVGTGVLIGLFMRSAMGSVMRSVMGSAMVVQILNGDSLKLTCLQLYRTSSVAKNGTSRALQQEQEDARPWLRMVEAPKKFSPMC